MAAERRFRAMGTDAHVVVHGDPLLAELAEAEIERLERRWSRFRPDSEVSEVNRLAGEWVRVSPETIELFDVISVSAGIRGTQIFLAPADYLRATSARVGAIAVVKESN